VHEMSTPAPADRHEGVTWTSWRAACARLVPQVRQRRSACRLLRAARSSPQQAGCIMYRACLHGERGCSAARASLPPIPRNQPSTGTTRTGGGRRWRVLTETSGHSSLSPRIGTAPSARRSMGRAWTGRGSWACRSGGTPISTSSLRPADRRRSWSRRADRAAPKRG